MKTKQTKPDLRVPTPEDYNPACATVWTNHGEPQPIDDKHFGVALQTEVETETTRQAETDLTWWTYWQYNDEIKRLNLELIQARLERGQFRKERDELLRALKCCLIEKPVNWNAHQMWNLIANASK